MDFTTLMRSGKQTGDHAMSFHVPETWMQGRTTYGGLTAALCLQAAMPTSGGRQIRSAQVAFVGPVSGDVECTATLLREGKNTVFTSVRMMGEAGVAAEQLQHAAGEWKPPDVGCARRRHVSLDAAQGWLGSAGRGFRPGTRRRTTACGNVDADRTGPYQLHDMDGRIPDR